MPQIIMSIRPRGWLLIFTMRLNSVLWKLLNVRMHGLWLMLAFENGLYRVFHFLFYTVLMQIKL